MPHPELCFGGGEGSFYVGNAHALYRGQEMRACSLPLSWRMVPGSLFDTRQTLSSGPGPDASKQLAARDGYLSAVSQLKSVPAHAGRRCIPLSLGMSPPLMLLCCATSKLVGDLCLPCNL